MKSAFLKLWIVILGRLLLAFIQTVTIQERIGVSMIQISLLMRGAFAALASVETDPKNPEAVSALMMRYRHLMGHFARK